jgi:type IV pilus assembly protein PilB
MKIEPFLVASTVNIAIGQRLLRKICGECKEPEKMTKAFFEERSDGVRVPPLKEGQRFFVGRGCDVCHGTGYKGRLCVNEVMVVDDMLRDAILRKASSSEIKSIAVKNGMTTMLEDGIIKAQEGQTTIEEVFRVIYE